MHNHYESIADIPGWEGRIGTCSQCGEIVYAHPLKAGGYKITELYEGYQIHRHGAYNNYVDGHECGIIQSGKLFLAPLTVSDEIKDAVEATDADGLQKYALKRVLSEFGGKRIRSGFKKSIYAQATAYMNGECKYRNPFSPRQLVNLIQTTTMRAD